MVEKKERKDTKRDGLERGCRVLAASNRVWASAFQVVPGAAPQKMGHRPQVTSRRSANKMSHDRALRSDWHGQQGCRRSCQISSSGCDHPKSKMGPCQPILLWGARWTHRVTGRLCAVVGSP